MTTLDRTIPPAYKQVDNVTFAWPNAVAADMPLFVLQKNDLELIHVTVLTGASRHNEPHHGVAQMTGKMLLEGTTHKDTKQIADYIDYYGAHMHITHRPDYTSIELTTLPKYIEPMVELLAELVSTSIFPEAQMAHLKKIKIQELKVENEQNHLLAYTHFKQAVLGQQHAYSYRLSEDEVMEITRTHLWDHYQQYWLPSCEIIMSGNITAQVLALVQGSFAFLKHAQPTPPSSTLAIQPPTTVHIPKPGSLQSAICIGKVLFPQTHPDYAAMYVVTVLLGGYFGSRLVCNIREEKGYTYHIEATLVPLQAVTYFIITTEVMQQFSPQACQEIYHEIALLQNEEVSQAELDKLKNYMIGDLLTHLYDPFYVMDRFKEAHLHQLDEIIYHQLFTTIRNITPQDIQRLAQQYLALDSFTEVCVG